MLDTISRKEEKLAPKCYYFFCLPTFVIKSIQSTVLPGFDHLKIVSVHHLRISFQSSDFPRCLGSLVQSELCLLIRMSAPRIETV